MSCHISKENAPRANAQDEKDQEKDNGEDDKEDDRERGENDPSSIFNLVTTKSFV